MDLMLINPPREVPQKADFPPMGLAYIAAYLNQNGLEAAVLDAANLSWQRLSQQLRKASPAVVGITCWTVERGQSFQTARIVHQELPRARIIMGGHHATAFPEQMIPVCGADAVVLGEGEVTTLELIRALQAKADLQAVKGIVFRGPDGKICKTPDRDLIADLDALPFPCHDAFDLSNYLGLPEFPGRAASIMTSRGCPHRCIYCSGSTFWRRRWRPRSPENVLAEIQWLYDDLHVRNLMFFDDNFTVQKDRAIAICRGIIEKGMKIRFVAESHVSHVNAELLSWMRRAGCYRMDFGVESGSPKILKAINKKQTVEQIEAVFKMVHAAGIRPRAYLMIGNPGEDEQTIMETAELMRRIKPWDTRGAHPLLIMPNTEIYVMAKAQGLITDDFWTSDSRMRFYTGEHSEKALIGLRERLMRELVRGQGTYEYMRYLAKKYYYRYPILQKLRRWRSLFGERI